MYTVDSSKLLVELISSDWLGMWQVWRRGQLHTGSWFGDRRESDSWENLGVDEKIILKRIFEKRNG